MADNAESQEENLHEASYEEKVAMAIAAIRKCNLSTAAKDYIANLFNESNRPSGSNQAPPTPATRSSSNENKNGITSDIGGIDLNKLVRRPRMFDGSNRLAREWLEEYEFSCELNSWNEENMVKYFPAYLESSALRWFKHYVKIPAKEQNIKLTWKHITKCFNKNYFTAMNKAKIGKQIDYRYQKQNEAVNSFISDMRSLFQIYDSTIPEHKQIEKIRERLLPMYHQLIAVNDPNTYDDLVELCVKIEVGNEDEVSAKARPSNMIAGLRYNQVSNDTDKRQLSQRKITPSSNSTKFEIKQNKDVTTENCSRCERPGHTKSACFAKTRADRSELKDKPPCAPPARKSTPRQHNSEPQPLIRKVPTEITKIKHVAMIVGAI